MTGIGGQYHRNIHFGFEISTILLDNTHILSLDFNPGEGRLFRIQKKTLSNNFIILGPDSSGNNIVVRNYKYSEFSKIYLEVPDSFKGGIISIYSLKGDIVYTSKISQREIEINMHNLSTQIYLISIFNQKSCLTKKLIIP